jgi:molybdopterin-guanine dinucleotide biosynthesis protein A
VKKRTVESVALSPAILLCGGKSSRMGQPKGLVLHQGKPWLEHQLVAMRDVGISEAVIVLGYTAEEYLAKLPWLVDALLRYGTEVFGLKIRALINPLPQFGPFSSIQVGGANAQRLSHAFSGYFWILPIDVPCPKKATWEKLARCRAKACIPTHLGIGGHPVRISDAFLRRLRKVPPYGQDSRLDRQIYNLGSEAMRLEVDDPGILKNLNTPSEMKNFDNEREAPGP